MTLELDESRSLQAQIIGLGLMFGGAIAVVVLSQSTEIRLLHIALLVEGAGIGLLSKLVYVGAVDAPAEP